MGNLENVTWVTPGNMSILRFDEASRFLAATADHSLHALFGALSPASELSSAAPGRPVSAAQRLLRIVTTRRRVLIGVPRVTWALPAREGP